MGNLRLVCYPGDDVAFESAVHALFARLAIGAATDDELAAAVVEELRRIGAHIRATADGFRIRGVPSRLRGGVVDSRGDHRLAMVGAVAGLSSREGVDVRGAEAVGTSFPGFFGVLDQLSTV